ncbi:MAG TPA: cytochrome c peroxidase [Gemmatimonadaceae bacterium]
MIAALVIAALVIVAGVTIAANGPKRFRLARAASADSSRAHGVRALLTRELDSLDARLARADAATSREGALEASHAARVPYRQLEVMLARYSPTLMMQLNSDETNEPDEDTADGFKVRQGFLLLDSLFADDGAHDSTWKREIVRMRLDANRFRPTVNLIAPSEREIIDLSRGEVGRVATLTITGFDANPDDALPDVAASLGGVVSLLEASGIGDSASIRRVNAAQQFVVAHADFATFDRYAFVRDFVNASFVSLATFRKTIPGVEPPVRSTWPATAGTIYDPRNLDVMSYAPDNTPPVDSVWAMVGRQLFFDTRLSESNDRSCASCHVPELAFRDGRARALARNVPGQPPTPLRHTPTLINAALQPSQFSDGRRSALEQQIKDVLSNPREMGGNLDAVVARIASDDHYRSQLAATAGVPGRVVDARSIETALASYVRTLRAFNSPFDRAIRGEGDLDEPARRGFNLFMGRASCGTCHFAPLFNGTQPPNFTQSEPEVIDVPADGANGADRDLGRGAVDRRGGLAHAFKTPTIRNTALGGPFMHNGVFRTLDEVIAFYDAGGTTTGRAIRPRNVTLSSDSLHLGATDKSDLKAFIASLTDTTGLTRRK